jgi:hypothetical protein
MLPTGILILGLAVIFKPFAETRVTIPEVLKMVPWTSPEDNLPSGFSFKTVIVSCALTSTEERIRISAE